ncbi:MAG: pyrroline-5-carboxylate reductase, partial [Planctomycetales bacterium]|nr:pyrroline-5-carboxylate reductase [Planctomycetales bacterium]
MGGKLTQLGFIGAGRMATALAQGCVKAGRIDAASVVASDPIEGAKQAFLQATPGASIVADNAEVLRRSDLVVLAVKPQVINDVLEAIRPHVEGRHLLTSIAAGVTLERIGARTPAGTRLIRVMPNTPCLIGLGASALSRGDAATDEDVATVKTLLESVGQAYEVDECDLDAVTGLSGSGPAFVYTMVEALAEGGVEAGLTASLSLKLAIATVRGAAAMFEATGLSPAALREQVTSPGGTTLAGLAALDELGGPAAMRR